MPPKTEKTVAAKKKAKALKKIKERTPKKDREARKTKLQEKANARKAEVDAKKVVLAEKKQKAQATMDVLNGTLSKLEKSEQFAAGRALDRFYRERLLAIEEEEQEDKTASRAGQVVADSELDQLLDFISDAGEDMILAYDPATLKRVLLILDTIAGDQDDYEAPDDLLQILLTECALEDRL